MKSAYFALFALIGCVGDSPVTTNDAGPDTSTTQDAGGDGTTAKDGASDAPGETGPAPCGYPGEDCCLAPMAPCNDGLTCSTSSTPKCMVSEAWAVGTYTTKTSNDLPTVFEVAHYDGSTWTLGTPIKTIPFSFNSYDPIDIYENGTNVRVISTEANVGHEYWWSGVSWQDCKLGNSCVGPTMTVDAWAITSVLNSGNPDYWIAGTNVMYRCASGASSCTTVTGIPGTWGTGNFAGDTAQDLWYSDVDHVLHFDGTNWTSTALTDATFITKVDTNDLWVGYTQLHHWDGNAWSNAFLIDGAKAPGFIYSLSGSGSKDVFAVGHDSSSSFAAHWDGTGWKKTTLPADAAGLSKVWAPSPIEAFVVGSTTPGGNKGFIGHWDGTKWTEMPSPTATVTGETQTGTLSWISVHGTARSRRH